MPQADRRKRSAGPFSMRARNNIWQPKDVPDSLLRELVDLAKMGPTSANCLPARFVFVKSKAEKEKLKPFLSEGNRDKTMQAPVCAIIGYDLEFYEHLPKLFPHTDARSWFAGKPEDHADTALPQRHVAGRLSDHRGAALGLDCGPMSGFDNAGVDAEFFAGTTRQIEFPLQPGLWRSIRRQSRACRGSPSTKWRRSYDISAFIFGW